MAKERVAHIDMASGIMILFMMLGHLNAKHIFLGDINLYTYLKRLFFFFMPWFFYKSGMFFVQQKRANIGGGKLLKPFAIWSAIGYIIYAVTQIFWGASTLFQSLIIQPSKYALFQNLILCNKPLWFLLTLYCVINIANVFMKYIHPLIIAVLGLLLGYGLFLLGNEYIPDLLANTAVGLSFFSIGYYMNSMENKVRVFIVAIVGYICAIGLLHSPYVDMRVNICYADRSGYDYFLWYMSSICGIIILNALCKYLKRIYCFPLLRFIGRNAMLFFVSHYVIIYALTAIYNNALKETIVQYPILPIISFIVIQGLMILGVQIFQNRKQIVINK